MSNTKEAIISVDNVSVFYDGKQTKVPAIENVSLEIDQGEFVCLVGPSGCGKSTLLKIIAGYIQPSQGKAFMKEEEITQADWRRGVVFQSPTLYPWLTVRKNIEYGPKVRKVSKEECAKLSTYYLDEVGLTEFADHHPYELSGGMKQRVSLARALANQPEIILMDEPFSALDAITRVKMQDFLREMWQKNNQTILLITHDIDEALALGTKVAIMSKNPGKIEKIIDVEYSKKIMMDSNYEFENDTSYIHDKSEILKMISE